MSESPESAFVSFVGTKQCEYCLSTKVAPLQRCSECKCVYYCNRQHQRDDWKKHKPLCTAATFNPARLNKKVELQSLVRAINLVVMQVGKRWHSTYKISKVEYKPSENVPQTYIDKIVREEEEKKNLHQSPRVEEVVEDDQNIISASMSQVSIDDSKLVEVLLYLEPENPSNISIIEQWTTEAEQEFQNIPKKLTKLTLDEWQRKLLYCNRGIEVNLMIALWTEHLLNLGLPRWEVIHSKVGGRVTSVHVECYAIDKTKIQTATKLFMDDQQSESIFEYSESNLKNLQESDEPNKLFHLVTVLQINNKEFVLDGTAFQFDIFQTVDVDGDIPFYLVPKEEYETKWTPLKMNSTIPKEPLEFLQFLKNRGKEEQGNVEENFQMLIKEGFDL